MHIFGTILPYIGKRRIPLNRDGSLVDTGKVDLIDESGYYYVKPWVFEWFGLGMPFTASLVYLTATDEIVTNPSFDTTS